MMTTSDALPWALRASGEVAMHRYSFYRGSFPDRFLFLSFNTGATTMINLAYGGESCAVDELVTTFGTIRDSIRTIALSAPEVIGSARIDFSPNFNAVDNALFLTEWMREIGLGPAMFPTVSDQLIADIAPYMLVSPTHISRLKNSSGFIRVGEGLDEMERPPIADWVWDSPARASCRKRAAAELRALVPGPEEVRRLCGARLKEKNDELH